MAIQIAETARPCEEIAVNLRENRFIPSMARCMTRRKSMRSASSLSADEANLRTMSSQLKRFA